MKLRYFVIGPRGILRKVPGWAIRALWEGRCGAEAIGGYLPHELRVVTIACNNHLLPKKIYLLRLPLNDGQFTEESYFTLQTFTRSECVTVPEMIDHHTGGWPSNFYQQLAVALNCHGVVQSLPSSLSNGPAVSEPGLPARRWRQRSRKKRPRLRAWCRPVTKPT